MSNTHVVGVCILSSLSHPSEGRGALYRRLPYYRPE